MEKSKYTCSKKISVHVNKQTNKCFIVEQDAHNEQLECILVSGWIESNYNKLVQVYHGDYVNQLYTVIFLFIILLIVGVLLDNKAFVCLFVNMNWYFFRTCVLWFFHLSLVKTIVKSAKISVVYLYQLIVIRFYSTVLFNRKLEYTPPKPINYSEKRTKRQDKCVLNVLKLESKEWILLSDWLTQIT
jgi:hypothetical protein